jgi:hypothetical protein
MQEAARQRVKAYIADVPANLRAQVHEAVRTSFSEIRLLEYGIQVSDGYRPAMERASPVPFLEENVTFIMETGLANRERALQVSSLLSCRF